MGATKGLIIQEDVQMVDAFLTGQKPGAYQEGKTYMNSLNMLEVLPYKLSPLLTLAGNGGIAEMSANGTIAYGFSVSVSTVTVFSVNIATNTVTGSFSGTTVGNNSVLSTGRRLIRVGSDLFFLCVGNGQNVIQRFRATLDASGNITALTNGTNLTLWGSPQTATRFHVHNNVCWGTSSTGDTRVVDLTTTSTNTAMVVDSRFVAGTVKAYSARKNLTYFIYNDGTDNQLATIDAAGVITAIQNLGAVTGTLYLSDDMQKVIIQDSTNLKIYTYPYSLSAPLLSEFNYTNESGHLFLVLPFMYENKPACIIANVIYQII